MALSLYDPFMGSALYDPFSLFLGTPIGGGGQVSSSRGVLEQRLRPIHLDVKGCPFLFFLFHCFSLFCSFPSRRRQVSLKGERAGGKVRADGGGFRGKGETSDEDGRVLSSPRHIVASSSPATHAIKLVPSLPQPFSSSSPPPIHQKNAETDKAFEILADVPGVEDSRVNLSVDGDLVTIEVSEEHEKKEEGPQARYYRPERSASFQSRSVRLPPSAKMDELKADFEHGVLHVRVPKEKKGEKGPRRIKIGG